MGGHLRHCHECGHEHISCNACRNRHCPKCNGLRRLQWIEARKAEAMPGGYAHIVFTLPHDLNDLCREDPHPIYNLLFQAAWETLEAFAAMLSKSAYAAQTFTGEGMLQVEESETYFRLYEIIPGPDGTKIREVTPVK